MKCLVKPNPAVERTCAQSRAGRSLLRQINTNPHTKGIYMINLQRIISTILALVAVLVSSEAYCSDASISQAWQSRSQLATDKLKQPKLDACDIAVEKAFQNAVSKRGEGLTIYELNIQIGNETMKAAYSYKDRTLKDFLLISLPSRWLAHQSPNSQLFSVVVVNSNCAFDLCVNNPLSTSSCSAHQ